MIVMAHHYPPTMSNLFNLTGDALRLHRQIDDASEQLFSNDPEEVAAAVKTLEDLIAAESDTRRQMEAKADAWCWVIDRMRSQAEAQAAHAKRLGELAAAGSRRADALQDQLIAALQKLDPEATRFNLPEHTINSRKSQSVEVTAETMDLPDQFIRVKTSYIPDKVSLKAALKAGQKIEGVELVDRRGWIIS